MSWFYYILRRLFLKLKGLSDVSVASLTKKEYGLAVHFFVDINEIFTAKVWWMIYGNLLGSFLLGIFMIKKWVEFSLHFLEP